MGIVSGEEAYFVTRTQQQMMHSDKAAKHSSDVTRKLSK
jgi:hypothetical protein